jgi:D-amino-acid dehydrogenase
MRVVVLGAGVTGIAAAWFLQRAGHAVTVIDRQPAAGMETSFANGGQISVSHAVPWATPGAPLKLLKWLGREDAPLLFRLRADWQQWRWAFAFLRECTPARLRRNVRQLVALGLYSRATLQSLRAELGLEYDQLARGILHFYTSARELDAAQASAPLLRAHGCELEFLAPDAGVQVEPALAQCRERLAGGSFTPSDESGDAHRFTQALAGRCAQAGVQLRHDTRILGVVRDGARLAAVTVASAEGRVSEVRADAFVLCLGSFSPMLARELGLSLCIVPAKGYSVTLPVQDPAHAYSVSLTDDEHKLVFSRLGDRLRIAGTAEFAGHDTHLNLARCRAVVRRVRGLFPRMTDGRDARFWTGLRPATPSNVPYLGRSGVANLFLDTGHGTLGWTHACGSGRAIADLVSGRVPEVDFDFAGSGAAGR